MSVRFGITAGVSFVLVGALSTLAASPDVQAVLPRGAQRGTDAELIFRGARLADANDILFYEPGIAVTKLESATAAEAKFHIQIAKDAKIGQYPLRLRTATGLSELRTFYVTPFPIVQEKEPNNDLPHAQPIELNTTVAGVIENEDVDTFIVESKKGQRLTAEVHGMRLANALGAMFDPYVAILDARRFILAESDDTALAKQDPIASAIVPADGKYYIQLRDTSYQGGGNFHYLLHVGTFPRPTAVYPAGGKVGEGLSVKFLGDMTGEFTQTVNLPAEPTEQFDIFAQQDGLTPPSANFLRVSTFPNVLEQPGDNDLQHATPVTPDLPVALNGIISKPNEMDYFRFHAKKNQVTDVRVLARALRSPLDSVLVIYDSKGNQLAANDDSGGPDSYLRFTPPADGEYVAGIFDQLHHGGADYVYRIELTPVEPKCTLQIPQYAINSQERNWIVVPRGNRFAQLFRATRADFGGELKLACPDLPQGVSMRCENMAANSDLVPVVFEAAPDAPIGGKLCELNAQAPDGKVNVKGEYRQPVEMVIGINNQSMYTIELPKLCVAVAQAAPFKIRVTQPKAPIVQGGQMNLKVVAERSDGFKGPINVRMVFNPPGIGSAPAVDIPADKTEIDYPVSANDGAPVRKWKVCLLGMADVNGPMWASSDLVDLDVSEPFVQMNIEMAAAEQGKPCSVLAHLDPKTKFDGEADVKLIGLPAGASAQDMKVTADDKQVVFNVTTSPTTPPGQHGTLFCQLTVMKDGEPVVHNLARGGVLRVDPPPKPEKGQQQPKPAVVVSKAPAAKPLSRLEKLRLEAQGK